jgi:hypothetical protein
MKFRLATSYSYFKLINVANEFESFDINRTANSFLGNISAKIGSVLRVEPKYFKGCITLKRIHSMLLTQSTSKQRTIVYAVHGCEWDVLTLCPSGLTRAFGHVPQKIYLKLE